MSDKELVDKVAYKRAARLQGHAPHKLFKMEIKKYLAKKKKKLDIFDINRITWKDIDDDVA